jgi:mannose-6-phosphate isomerase-like protein (cupin superfamily)
LINAVNLDAALATFDDVWSPRIIARVNDYDVRVAKVRGLHVWHTHDTTDEFFLVLDGDFAIDLREPDGSQSTVTLVRGDTFVVPRGVEHRPHSTGGAILMFEATGTVTTGDHHDLIPDHVDSTTGHQLVTDVS